MSVLIFLLVLIVLIAVHEWGHYITAKLTGMRVDEFAIGFPPKLFTFKKGETVYSINLIPIGGFVKILGENGDEDDEKLSELDKTRTFSARPKWAQAVVLIAGVTMNVVLAWVLLVAILLMGTPVEVDESQAGPDAKLVVLATLPGSPAEVIPQNATILGASRGSTTLSQLTPTAFTEFVGATAAPVTISYTAKKDVVSEVTLTPKAGLSKADPERAIVGISSGLVQVEQYGLSEAVYQATLQTWATTVAIVRSVSELIVKTVSGTADFAQLSGPVGIVKHVGVAAELGFSSILLFTAVISLNLAVMNMLPVPALDGGRLVFVAIEAITRRRISPVWAGRVNAVGFGLLILLMIAVTYHDIVKMF